MWFSNYRYLAQAGALGMSAVLLAAMPQLAEAVPLPAASYLFNNTLAAQQPGVSALTAVDPISASGFVSDTVFGQSRTVYAFTGNASPATQQAGLSVSATGLVANSNYSFETVFEFTQNPSGWRRILDVQNRQADNGFYVNTSSQLAVFPITGGSTFTNNAYHHVVLVDSAGTVSAYLDGALAFTTATAIMDIANPGNLLNFFLDNTASGGQGEYSNGRVALIRLYQGALSAADVAALASAPFAESSPAPSPGTFWLFGVGGLAWLARRRRSPA